MSKSQKNYDFTVAPAKHDGVIHQRGILVENMRHMRGEIEKIFIDAAHWSRLHPDEEPIDPDPDGELRRIADALDVALAKEVGGVQ